MSSPSETASERLRRLTEEARRSAEQADADLGASRGRQQDRAQTLQDLIRQGDARPEPASTSNASPSGEAPARRRAPARRPASEDAAPARRAPARRPAPEAPAESRAESAGATDDVPRGRGGRPLSQTPSAIRSRERAAAARAAMEERAREARETTPEEDRADLEREAARRPVRRRRPTGPVQGELGLQTSFANRPLVDDEIARLMNRMYGYGTKQSMDRMSKALR